MKTYKLDYFHGGESFYTLEEAVAEATTILETEYQGVSEEIEIDEITFTKDGEQLSRQAKATVTIWDNGDIEVGVRN
jgi:hypothetical protein